MLTAPAAGPGPQGERQVTLGELRRCALRLVPGQKIAYVTDVADDSRNASRIVALAAGARTLIPFHFSPRYSFSPSYSGRESELRAEAAEAFRGAST